MRCFDLPRLLLASVLLLSLAMSSGAQAEGTETLGPPGVALAPGTGIAIGGVGLDAAQPQSIALQIPDGVAIRQVLLYWSGGAVPPNPADFLLGVGPLQTIGVQIGGPVFFFESQGSNVFFSGFRSDITNLNLVAPGANAVPVFGLDFRNNDAGENHGAALVAIYDDGSPAADIQLVDGVDPAFEGFAADARGSTVPQTFSFAPSSRDRIADLALVVASVEAGRSSLIRIDVNGAVTDVVDAFGSTNGPLIDAVRVPVNVPAGASQIRVELISTAGPAGPAAALSWLSAAVSLSAPDAPPPPPPEPDPAIAIELSPEFQRVRAGELATFEIAVTNSGGRELSQVQVVDARVPACDRSLGSLPVGERVVYTCAAPVSTSLINEAVASGADDAGIAVEARDTATVVVLRRGGDDDDDEDDDDDGGDDDDDD